MICAPAALPVTTEQQIQTRIGETVTLSCSFGVSPYGARITWEKDGVNIVTLSDCSSYSITSCTSNIPSHVKHSINGNLHTGVHLQVTEITLDDDGIYECKVIASEGFGKSGVRLIVSCKEIIDILFSE